MKTLIAVLTIISLLQTTVISLELVLIILICRSYIKTDRTNLILAFGFGLLIGQLNLNLLGLTSILYLFTVQITQVLSKTRLAGNSFLIIPLSLGLLAINHLVLGTFSLPKVILEALISLPIFYLIRVWEERFIVRRDIKLKL